MMYIIMNKARITEMAMETQRLHTDAHNYANIAAKARRAARLDSGYYFDETDESRNNRQQTAIQRAHRYTQRAELFRQRLIHAKRELQIVISNYKQHRRDARQSEAIF